MDWLSTLLRPVGAVLGALMPSLKQRYAERKAGEHPSAVATSVADDVLDAALIRLGALRPEDPLWKRCIAGLEATAVRPELFVRLSVREWASKPQVQQDLKKAAEISIARGQAPQNLIDRLADEYAEATGDDRRFADQPIRIAIAFLRASVQGLTRDPGTAAIVQATTSDLGAKIGQIDERVADLAEQAGLSRNPALAARLTREGRSDLQKILRRRATEGQQPVAELRKLIGEFNVGGRLAGAEAVLRNEATYWLARMEAAAGELDNAQLLFSELERSGYPIPSAAWALLDLARNEPEIALRRVRDLTDAESRGAVFYILLKSEGRSAALRYVDDLLPADPSAFTATGWLSICVSMFAEGRHLDAASVLSRLPPEVLGECTQLYYMYAVSTLLPMLSADGQASMAHAGFLAIAEHVLDGPESISARSLALEAAELAMRCALASDDQLVAERCATGVRCLRLLDPDTRDEETAAIVEAMNDGEAAVRLIGVARAYDIKFDPQALETYLSRTQRLGGLNEAQLRAKWYLLDAPDRAPDLVRFLDEEWVNLALHNSVAALIVSKVQALTRTGDFDGAAAFLEAHAGDLGESVAPRLRLMIRDARGEDPTDEAVGLFERSNAIEDLRNLVQVLWSRSRWRGLAPYAELLFAREPNFQNAMLRLNCLQRIKTSAKEISAFLEGTVGTVEQRPELRSARARAHFEAGNHLEAKRLNDELAAERVHVDDLALDVNIAIRTGDWDRFATLAVRGWERRSQLDSRMLLSLAQLVGFSDPAQALILAQEAVARDGDDPAILVAANAVAIAARSDDLGVSWVHKAAELSKQGGPVSTFSFREMVEFMKSNAESWREKNDLYRSAQVPLHMAASLFNAPLSQLLIAVPRQNTEEVDPRRRQPVPIRSGGREPIAAHAFTRVALDITTLFVLSEIGMLGDVLDSLDEAFVSPRVMELLLDDRRRVAFHQPSRIAEVKPLNAWVTSGRLKVIESKAEAPLTKEVGEEAAALLSEAKNRGGMFIHPGPLFRAASYMDEEATLGDLEPLVAGPIDVVTALHGEGTITQAACNEAVAALQRPGMAARRAVAPAVPLYLDGLAVQYLHGAKVLQPLLNSGHVIWIHRSTVDEWQALLATEPMTEQLTAAIDELRRTVRSGLLTGKVKFLAQSRKQRDELNAPAMLPLVDLLEDTADAEAAVIDDRMLGGNPTLTDSTGRSVPLLSSLDLLDALVTRGKVSKTSQRESLHLLRSRCFFCIPIASDDLSFYVGQATVRDGKLKETAELRAIRQYLARLNSTDVLCTGADLNYQDSLWRVATVAIGTLWQDVGIPTSDASAKSDWIAANILPDLELALRFAPDRESRIDDLAAARLAVSLMPPGVDRERRRAYTRWFEQSRLSPLVPGNTGVLDLAAIHAAQILIDKNLEMARELRSRDRTGSAE